MILKIAVTVHEVDTGIDTGNIIYQKTIDVTTKDNFSTYPLLQLAEGIIYLKKALADIFSNNVTLKKNNLEVKYGIIRLLVNIYIIAFSIKKNKNISLI